MEARYPDDEGYETSAGGDGAVEDGGAPGTISSVLVRANLIEAAVRRDRMVTMHCCMLRCRRALKLSAIVASLQQRITVPETELSHKAPKIAYAVCAFHAAVIVASLCFTTFIFPPSALLECTSNGKDVTEFVPTGICHAIDWRVITVAFAFGCLGGATNASRYVVWAVRHGKYANDRLLWQLMTPLHGGLLAVIAIYVAFGGLFAIAKAPTPNTNYGYFVGSFGFVVGLASELFVKRLIRAAEALFGERDGHALGNADETTHGNEND